MRKKMTLLLLIALVLPSFGQQSFFVQNSQNLQFVSPVENKLDTFVQTLVASPNNYETQVCPLDIASSSGSRVSIRCLKENRHILQNDTDSNASRESRELRFLNERIETLVQLSKNDLSSLGGGNIDLSSYFHTSNCLPLSNQEKYLELSEDLLVNSNLPNSCLALPSASMDQVCDCKRRKIEKGFEKAITREQTKELIEKAKVKQAKKSLRGLLSTYYSAIEKTNSLLTSSGKSKYKERFLNSSGAMACTPGSLKKSFKRNNCSSATLKKIENEIAKTLKECKDDFTPNCKFWNTFQRDGRLSTISDDSIGNLINTIDNESVDYYKLKSLDLFDLKDDSEISVLRTIANHNFNEFSVSDYSYIPKTKSDYQQFINKIQKHEINTSVRNMASTAFVPRAVLGLEQDSSLYGDAKFIYLDLITDPLYRDNHIVKAIQVDEEISVAEAIDRLYFRASDSYKEGLEQGGLEGVMDQIYSEGVDELISECNEVDNLINNFCELDNPFKSLSAEDFLTQESNDFLAALMGTLNDYPEGVEKERAKSVSTQLYCAMFASIADLDSKGGERTLDFDNMELDLTKVKSFRDVTSSVVANHIGDAKSEISEIYTKESTTLTDYGPELKSSTSIEAQNENPTVQTYGEGDEGITNFPPAFEMANNEITQLEQEFISLEDDGTPVPNELKNELANLTKRFKDISKQSNDNPAPSVVDSGLENLFTKLDKVNDKIKNLKKERESLTSKSNSEEKVVIAPKDVIPRASGEVESAPRSVAYTAPIAEPRSLSSLSSAGSIPVTRSLAPIQPLDPVEEQEIRNEVVKAVVSNEGLIFTKSDIAESVIVDSDENILNLLNQNQGEPVLVKIGEGLYEKYDLVENNLGEKEVIKTRVIVEDEFDVQQEEGIIERAPQKRRIFRLKDFENEFNKVQK